MFRIFKIFLTGIFLVILTACGGSSGNGTSHKNPVTKLDKEAPYVPKIVSVSSLGSDSIHIQWLPVSDNITPDDKIKYKIYASTTKNIIPNSANLKKELIATDDANITGLKSNTMYYIRVVAEDENNNTAWSEIETIKTNSIDTQISSNKIAETNKTINSNETEVDKNTTQGEIIFNADPNKGFLKKVEKIETKNGKKIAILKDATIEDVYKKYEYNTKIKLIDPTHTVTTNNPSNSHNKFSKLMKISLGNNVKYSRVWKNGMIITENKTDARVISSPSKRAKQIGYTYSNDTKTVSNDLGEISIPTKNIVEAGHEIEIPIKFSQNLDYELKVENDDYNNKCYVYRCKNINPSEVKIDSVKISKFINANNRSSKPRIKLKNGKYYLVWKPANSDASDEPHEFTLSVILAPYYGQQKIEVYNENISIKGKIYVSKGKVEPSKNKVQNVTFSSSAGFKVKNTFTMGFEPTIYLSEKFEDIKKEGNSKDIKVTGSIVLNQTLNINAYANTSLEQTKNIWSRGFVKVVFVGEVPVLLKGTMAVDIKFEGSASANIDIVEKFINKFDLTLGFNINHTKDGKYKITPIKEFNKSYSLTIDGKAEGKLSAKITIIPDLKLKVYELVATRVRLLPYMYGDVDIDGFFNYRNSSNENSSFDADYKFNNIEAGVGADLSLFIGRGWGRTWVDDWIQLTYPENAEVDDVSTHKIFHIVKQTPLIKLPTLSSSYDISKLPPKNIDNRAIWIKGNYSNESGVIETSKFKSWDKAKIVNNENLDAQIIKSNTDGGYWLIPGKEGEYNIRLIGHSKLGRWARQYTTVTFALNDDNNNGILDYWENRYPKPANMPEELYLKAFQNGEDPKTIKIEDPAKEDDNQNHKPNIDIKVSKHLVYEGEEVTLDASNSSDKDGDNLTFEWSDAEYWLGNKPIIKKKFKKGVHKIKLVVSDGKDKSSKTVVVLVKRKIKENTNKAIVDGVSPTVAYEDKPTVFTITGSNLDSNISGYLTNSNDCKKISSTKENIKISCTPKLNGSNSTYKNFIITNYDGEKLYKIYIKRNNVVEYQGSTKPYDTCHSFYEKGCEATALPDKSYTKSWTFKKSTNKKFKNLRVVAINEDPKVVVHIDKVEENKNIITVTMTLTVSKDAIGIHKGNFKLVDEYGDIVYKATGRSSYFWYMLNVQPELPKTITLNKIEDGVEGDVFTFKAQLSDSLDNAYSVKLSLGDGSGGWLKPIDMIANNNRTLFALAKKITTAGDRVYRVAIFNGNTRISDWIQGSYKVYEKSKIPKNVKVRENNDGSVTVQWDPVKDAPSYTLMYSLDGAYYGNYKTIKNIKETYYTFNSDTFLDNEIVYFSVGVTGGKQSEKVSIIYKKNNNIYYNNLAGKTLYALTKYNIVEFNFNKDLTSFIVDSNETITIKTKLDNNGLKLLGKKNYYLIIKKVNQNYLDVEYDELSDSGAIIKTEKKFKLYFDEKDVPIITGDLAKIIVGKTFYQHCKDDSGNVGIDSITFQRDGKIKIEEHNGNTFYIEYTINDNVITTKEKDDNEYKTHTFVKETNEYIQLNEENGEVTKLYKTYQAAQNAPVDDCGGDDGETEYNPRGKITYLGADYQIVKAHSYMSNMDNNEVQIFLQTDKNNPHAKGGLQFTLKKSFAKDNESFKSLLRNKKILYINRNNIIDYGIQFMAKNNTPTGVTWRSGSIKLIWQRDNIFTIEQNGASLGIKDFENNAINMIYFTKTYIQWTDKNYKNNDPEEKVSGLVSGHVDFSDYGYVPSDAWVGITPLRFQNDASGWNRLTCKIDSNGNFGNECYIDHNVQGMKQALQDRNEKFQVVVFKNTKEPEKHDWNGGEDVYKYVGSEEDYGSWKSIKVNKEDYQDRSDEKDTDSDSKKVSDLVSGHFNFVDENGSKVSIPSNLWVRITPQEYQVEGHWTGVNCKIDSNGNFGNECYIHRSEEEMRSKFNSNHKGTYQVVIYQETTGDTHYNREEEGFACINNCEDVRYNAWKNATARVFNNSGGHSSSDNTPVDPNLTVSISLSGNTLTAIFNKDMEHTYSVRGVGNYHISRSYWVNDKIFKMDFDYYDSNVTIRLEASGFITKEGKRLSEDVTFTFP